MPPAPPSSHLQGSRLDLEAVLRSVPDLIALLDERGEVVFSNREHIGELGDSNFFFESMTERGRSSWAAAVEQVLSYGMPAELELEFGEGPKPWDPDATRWFSVRLGPLERDETAASKATEGEPQRNVVMVATDISDRKRAEVARAELESQLRQQQRLESLGTLASGVAHEINNPVQGIMNYAELVAANVDEREIVLEFAHEIAHEAERVANIVRNLLAFCRQDREERLEATDLATLIEGTLSLLHGLLRKDHIRIEVDVPPLPIRCRAQQIRQIILNLVTNARDALVDHVSENDERRKIVIRGATAPGDRVQIIVEDFGPGIADHVLAHIFDPFFTTKGRDKGTGLGLSVSHGIAKEHGGDIFVETRLGEGTRFIVELPA